MGIFNNSSFPETRLKGEIADAESKLSYLIAQAKNPEANYLNNASKLLDECNRDLRKNQIDLAWRKLKTANRLMVFAFDRNMSIAEIQTLLGSNENMTGWRKKTIEELFPSAKKNEENEVIELGYRGFDIGKLHDNIRTAMKIRDEYYDNSYYQMGVSRLNFQRILWLFVSVSFGVSLFYAFAQSLGLFGNVNFLGPASNLFIYQFFGLLGASFSIVTKFTDADEVKDGLLPNSLKDGENLLLRPLIGPGAALIMYLFVRAEVLNPNMFKTGAVVAGQNPFDSVTAPILLLTFLAGFSERLVIQILEKLSQKVDVKPTQAASGGMTVVPSGTTSGSNTISQPKANPIVPIPTTSSPETPPQFPPQLPKAPPALEIPKADKRPLPPQGDESEVG
jgi:hypothetical protein